MIVTQHPDGRWVNADDGRVLSNTHPPAACEGRLCDVHDRRGPEPYASWPLNWREDRGFFEAICPCGIGHPSRPQADYWREQYPGENGWFPYLVAHGCCGIHCPTNPQMEETA